MTMAKKDRKEGLDRLAASIAAAMPDSEGEYRVSEALAEHERRRFLGIWQVSEHTVDGRPYVERFAASALRGVDLREPAYAAVYDFREALCLKRVRIGGRVDAEGGPVGYAYSMGVAISWELGPGCIYVRPELGYQASSLGGDPAAVRELGASGEAARIAYRFEGEHLFLEEGADLKRLERSAG